MAEVFGVEVPDLDEGWTALETVIAVKSLDQEGRSRIQLMVSDGLTVWEAVGILRCLEADMTNAFNSSLENGE